MLSTSVSLFTDPDECAAAQNNSTNETTVTQSGRYSAKHIRIELHRIAMQRLSEGLARTTNVTPWGTRVPLTFQTEPGPSQIRNGVELGFGSLQRSHPAHAYYERSSGAAAIGSVSLSVEDTTALGPVFLGANFTLLNDHAAATPDRSAMTKLLALHETAGHLAEYAPTVLAHPEAAHGLEQALIEAMFACIGGDAHDDRAALRHHASVMRKFHQVIERSADQPVYIPDLCREIGVSERTLRASCEEHLGMGPKRYLLLRRMNMVRRALQGAAPGEITVTEIATRYGFWQFGRLAVEYRALFGEPPSATLARPAH
jgi:AraC-like DNA-binding protein